MLIAMFNFCFFSLLRSCEVVYVADD